MIELNDPNGRKVFLAPDAIAEIYEAGPSSQWHGIRSCIKTFDGRTIEVQESAPDIAKQLP
mgnify:CR=1 FL=1